MACGAANLEILETSANDLCRAMPKPRGLDAVAVA
jgi:hypothetical protein